MHPVGWGSGGEGRLNVFEAMAAGCGFSFKHATCATPMADLCRGGCIIMAEWKALIARRSKSWRPPARYLPSNGNLAKEIAKDRQGALF